MNNDDLRSTVTARGLAAAHSLLGKKVIAELAYGADSRLIDWRAVVTTSTMINSEENMQASYILWIQVGVGADFMRAGEFFTIKALVKYVKSKARERFGDQAPVIDTFSKLGTRKPDSVVPLCYDNPLGNKKETCDKCLFRSTCQKTLEPVDTSDTQESDDEFLKRLQKKIAAKTWEV